MVWLLSLKVSKREVSFSTLGCVLIIRPGGIGDAVLLAPALRALHLKYPAAQIDLLVEKRNAGTFELVPEVNHVFLYDKLSHFIKMFRCSYDVVIDTEQWHRLSAVVARIIPSGLRIGFDTNERYKMFDCPVTYSHDDYEASSFCHLLEPLDIRCATYGDDPFLVVPALALKQAGDVLASLAGRAYVAVFPGASIKERQWGRGKFKSLAMKLSRRGVGVVVVGGKEDKDLGDHVVSEIEFGLNLAGRYSLAESAAFIAGADLLVSGDSGVLHVGVGLGQKTVSLFGPGIASKWAPRGDQHRVVNMNIDCSPCTRFGNTPKCPIDVKCLKDISVDEVYDAAMELLEVKG